MSETMPPLPPGYAAPPPTEPTFRILNPRKVASGFQFQCDSKAGLNYSWQATSNLRRPAWIQRRPSVPGTGTRLTFLDTEKPLPQKFYRVASNEQPAVQFTQQDIGSASVSTGARPFVKDGLLSVLAIGGAIRVLYGTQMGTIPIASSLYGGISQLRLKGTKLWLMSSYGAGPYTIHVYDLQPYGQLPTNAVPVGSWTFGSTTDWMGDFVVSNDGATVVSVWSDRANDKLVVKVWPSGEQILIPGSMKDPKAPCYTAGGQHPADGSYWFFGTRDFDPAPDGGGRMRALRLHLENGTPVLDWDRWDWIKQEGEFSVVRVLPDYEGQQLIVTRMINESVYYTDHPFRKGSYIGLRFINSDATYQELTWPQMQDPKVEGGLAECVSPYGVAFDSESELWLGSHQYNEGNNTFDLATVRRYDRGRQTWEDPLLLATSAPASRYRSGAFNDFIAAEGPPGLTQWFGSLSEVGYDTQCSIWRQE